jgi:hypothetical protein
MAYEVIDKSHARSPQPDTAGATVQQFSQNHLGRDAIFSEGVGQRDATLMQCVLRVGDRNPINSIGKYESHQ